MIDQFVTYDLFGRENYEYYARVTGRILRIKDEWICSFYYPLPPKGKQQTRRSLAPAKTMNKRNDTIFAIDYIVLFPVQLSFETEKTWLQYECERWGKSKWIQDKQIKILSKINCS